jgi:ankyrin repeat protein
MSTTIAGSESPIERFRRAVHDGNVDSLRRVLSESEEARAAINDPLFGFDSPALVSVAGGKNLAIIDALLEFGADPNRKSSWWAGGFHPLYAARGDVADRLLAAGAVADACAAAQLDRPDLLATILRDDPSRVHERGGDGQTPLHFARSREVVDMLLAAGADPDARDMDHRSTPAEWMIDRRGEMARYLVKRGASADIFLAAALGLTDTVRAMLSSGPGLLALRTSHGEYAEQPPSSYHIYHWTLGPNLSPLQVAARFRHADTVDVMTQYAGPVEKLLLACHLGDGDGARAVVREHPGIIENLGPVEQRALTDEAWGANAPAVELMLELGFDPSLPSASGPTGGTALHCAAWGGSVDCVSAILRYPAGRALVNARETTYDGTPLSWCSHGSVHGNPAHDHAGVARLLVAAGAKLEQEMTHWQGSPAFMKALSDAIQAAES